MTYTLQPQLSHSTLVPREHVHRDALSEVYLTDIICDRYPNFRIGVHLPKSHSYYSDHIGPAEFRYDPLLILECFRQTSILIAHRHVGAGFDQASSSTTPTSRSYPTRQRQSPLRWSTSGAVASDARPRFGAWLDNHLCASVARRGRPPRTVTGRFGR